MSLTAQYLFNNVQINFSLHLWLILCDSYIYFASTFVHLFTWFKISLCLSHSIYTTSIVQCDHMVWQSLRSVSVSNLFTATRRLWGREQPTYRKAQTWTCTHKKKEKSRCGFFCVCVWGRYDEELVVLTFHPVSERSVTLQQVTLHRGNPSRRTAEGLQKQRSA